MSRFLKLLPLFLLCFALAACGDKAPSGDADEHAEDHDEHDHSGQHGGTVVESSDHGAHFEIVHDEDAGLVKLYLYDGDMKPVTTDVAPVLNVSLDAGPVQIKGQSPGGAKVASEWHFTDKALIGHVHEARFRVSVMNRTYTPEFPHEDHDGDEHDDDDGHEHDADHKHKGGDGHKHDDDHGHEHDDDGHEKDGHEHDHAHEGPHHGMVHELFMGTTEVGHIELKLHDDKGDLELWIASDEAMKKPMDLGMDAKVTVTFTAPRKKSVTLTVRNQVKNEDEDGTGNVRNGKTNYFIFPGSSGEDATWLQGKAFKGTVTVSFKTAKGTYATKAFELKPHSH